jgi:hypothetical protein
MQANDLMQKNGGRRPSSSQFKFCPDAIRLPAIGAGAWVAASAGEFAIFRSILK